MVRPAIVTLALTGWLSGCAAFGFGAPEPPPDEGDPDAPPALDVLPPLDPDSPAATQGVRQAMLEARDALERRLPEPPLDRRHVVLQRWAEHEVAAWIHLHEEQVSEVRARLALEGPPSPAERVIEGALLGLMHEHVALELARMPAPRELDTEPEIAVMYRDVIESQVRPFVTSALVGYRDCANVAHDEASELMVWGRFCARRFARVKAEVEHADAPEDARSARVAD